MPGFRAWGSVPSPSPTWRGTGGRLACTSSAPQPAFQVAAAVPSGPALAALSSPAHSGLTHAAPDASGSQSPRLNRACLLLQPCTHASAAQLAMALGRLSQTVSMSRPPTTRPALSSANSMDRAMQLTAMTGAAAMLVGGRTLHACLGQGHQATATSLRMTACSCE